MHFSQSPTFLIVSPRDRIEMVVDIGLEPLTVEAREALESTIDTALDVSSLIEPIGGISLYPSMVVETDTLARAFEVTAHEWAHHYLMGFPLGLEYTPARGHHQRRLRSFRAGGRDVMALLSDLPAAVSEFSGETATRA